MNLEIRLLRRDGGTQPRAELNTLLVLSYEDDMRKGDQFPPVVAFYDGTDYWLADGFHRVVAALEIGRGEFDVDVRQGTRRDAMLFAASANAQHGQRRSGADKRRAVLMLLQDEEWGKWSDREIAERCKVSHPFVGKLRAEVTGNITSERTYVTRHGTQATMDTANIGGQRRSIPVQKLEADKLETDKVERGKLTPVPMGKLTPSAVIKSSEDLRTATGGYLRRPKPDEAADAAAPSGTESSGGHDGASQPDNSSTTGTEIVVPRGSIPGTPERNAATIANARDWAQYVESDARSLVRACRELRACKAWGTWLQGEPKTWERFCQEALGHDAAFIEAVEQAVVVLEQKAAA